MSCKQPKKFLGPVPGMPSMKDLRGFSSRGAVVLALVRSKIRISLVYTFFLVALFVFGGAFEAALKARSDTPDSDHHAFDEVGRVSFDHLY